MGVYDSAIATAKRLIAAKGEVVSWQPAADPTAAAEDTPWIQGEPTAADARRVAIVFLPIDRSNQQLIRALGGTELVTGNVYGLMGAVDFPVEFDAVITRSDGSTVALVNADKLAPNGDVILWTLEFKE